MTRRELARELRVIANYQKRRPQDNALLRRAADLLEKDDRLVEAAFALADRVVFTSGSTFQITDMPSFVEYFFAMVAVEAARRRVDPSWDG